MELGTSEPPSPSGRLLVVDDEEGFCDLVRFAAENVGFDVTSTTDAEQFPLYYSNDLSVVVLDLSMPGFDGIELIRFLADNRSQASIILMSGFDTHILNSARETAVEKGLHVLGALSKPFSMEELNTLITNIPAHPTAAPPPGGTDEFPSVEDLRQAIDNKELFVMYQPRIALQSRALVGVEALARWQHPLKGMIPPFMFIDFAEKHGLIDNLTSVIMEQAFEQCAAWRAEGLKIQVSVNMSARTLINLEFPEQLLSKVKEQGLEPSQVVIEVTESSVMDELARSLDILTRLRMKGFQLSIDDFGTGYSSMSQLQKIPFSELKIDQSFVMRSNTDAGARAIVETTIDLGRRLGMVVVAEGIEEQAHWDLLKELGCDQAQGYLMARPMPGEKLKDWLREWE
jgi:EAL domain-containing protein (putative c-di-GMP-specific phosphodiesterase class I)/ActR/RegA family two-component response regulator